MNYKVFLEYILFFFLLSYLTLQSLNAYYSLVVSKPPDITAIQQPLKTESFDDQLIQRDEPKPSEKRLPNVSSNIIMAWHNGKQFKYHSLSQEDFDQLTEMAAKLSKVEIDFLLERFKELTTENFIAILHDSRQKEQLIRLAKLSSKNDIAKINSL